MKPDDILITDRYGRDHRYHWVALDPAKADYQSRWGFRGPRGTTFLITGSGNVCAVGLWSGSTLDKSLPSVVHELLNLHDNRLYNLDRDRTIPAAQWKEWQL